MNKCLCLFVLGLFFCNQKSVAQLIGGECFLQGTYLEIGINNNGALGSCNAPPAGYHPHCPTCTPGGGGINTLAEVYDWGHDGWTTGTPAYMGDYTNPGTPFEGWSIQANGQINEAFQINTCPGAFGCCFSYFLTPPAVVGTLTGANTTYANALGKITGDWAGTALGGALSIKQETRVDVNASWVVMTVHLYNNTVSPISDVYYMRSCDPDNTTTWVPGGTSMTTNKIVYQNDWNHRVLVSAWDNGLLNPAYDSINTYLGLGTKDCRAKATFFHYSGLTYGNLIPQGSPEDIWNQSLITTAISGTAPFFYPYSVNAIDTLDVGIGLVFNIGTIAPNDSAVLSYAYIFNGNAGLDSAFPDPVLSINSTFTVLPVYPYNVKDTFDFCTYSGSGPVPVDISFGEDKCWTWSKWTWMPSTGLSATTGTHVCINKSALSGVTTYTVIGVDSAANNFSCNYRTFIFTVEPCRKALVNSPCIGEPLYFNFLGDSTGATYNWLGPNSLTATVAASQAFTIVHSTWLDTGTYWVVKTVSGVPDTAKVQVTLHPKPVATATSNSPLCDDPVTANALSLNATTSGAAITSYYWTGPLYFTSSLQNPSIPGFTAADTGMYTIVVISDHGCRDTASTLVSLLPPPAPPLVVADTTYCFAQPFVQPYCITVPDASLYWSTSVTQTPLFTPDAPVINTSVSGNHVLYFWQTIGFCTSPVDSITIKVDDKVIVQVRDAVSPYGSYLQAFSDRSLFYRWTPVDGSLNDPNINNPIATPDVTTMYSVIGMYEYGCTDTGYVTVTVDDDLEEFIPSGFTPNGDGLNDYFRPAGGRFKRMADFRIFNRWGEVVYYSSSDKDKGWDGKLNGIPQDAGVYFYSITVSSLHSGGNAIFKGEVTLIR